MRSFAYTSPETLDEAVALLSEGAETGACPLAGGTDLLTLLKADVGDPGCLVNVKRLAGLSRAIEPDGDGLRLGALTPLADIERHPLVWDRYPVLAEACEVAATPQLRNMATIGGNLLQRPRCWYFRNPRFHCWLQGGEDCPARTGENQQHSLFGEGPCVAVHPSDPAPALLALGAEVQLRGSGGERTVPLEAFYALPTDERRQETTIGQDEILTSVRIPALPAGTRSTYFKSMDRKIWAFALVSVAAVLRTEGPNGSGAPRIADARLVVGGVAPIPWRTRTAEQELIGHGATPERFAHAAEAALADARPLSENGYKTPLAKTLITRALASLLPP